MRRRSREEQQQLTLIAGQTDWPQSAGQPDTQVLGMGSILQYVCDPGAPWFLIAHGSAEANSIWPRTGTSELELIVRRTWQMPKHS
jgi:hypothetical protein